MDFKDAVLGSKKYFVDDFIVYINDTNKTITIERDGKFKCSSFGEALDFRYTKGLLSFIFNTKID